MLQRAASNAYSWWWASHIRTKQSKWMEQNLQDMEEKVAITLKLIEEDGDSFAKRAEMYYKRRPELINFVEESFRAYRALADRYDHLSSELQNANNTIASVFPDQVQFSMDDDDDDNSPRMQKRPPEIGKSNIPNVPNMPTKEFKRTLTSCKKKLLPSKSMKKNLAAKSGLSKPEGLNKIDKLQKQILALQTEKEFVKSSYESRLAKYWDIENQIVEAQEQVCSLEDEFGEGMIIEDDDARVLMAAAAINSCQETLAELEEKQEISAEQAKAEDKKIKLARNRLVSFKDESVDNEASHKNSDAKFDSDKAVEDIGRLDEDVESDKQKREDSEALGQKKDEHFEVASNASLSVTEMAEKIDELVNKVISLETAVSSQESLLQRLRTETDELQAQIQTLEDDKATLIKAKDELSIKLMETEKKLLGLQNLNSNVEDQNNNLQTTNDRCNLEHSSKTEETSSVQTKLQKQSEEQEGAMNPSDGLKKQRSVKLSEDLDTDSLERENIQGGELKLTEASEKLQSVKLSEDLVTTPLERENIQGGELKLTEGSEKLQSVKLSENLVITSLERENIQGGELKLTEGSEKLHSEKLDEDVKVSGAKQLEEKSMVKVGSTKDFKEQEEILNKGDNSKNARDVQKEEVKGIKEHDISATTRNQGEVSQSQENGEPGDLLEKSQDQKNQDKVDKQVSSLPQVVATKQDDEPDWKQLFLNGMENKEKVLLTEYTTILRNFKELKKKLSEGDTKNEDCKLQMTKQLKELNSVNAKKDEEIRSLRQKLSFLQQGFDQSNNLDYQATVSEIPAEGEEDNGVIQEDEDQSISPVEEKFRMEIDELLEENLDFWLRFSTAFHQIQKFETEVKDLQAEVSKLEEKQNKGEGSSSHKYSLKSDVRPIYKHLKEIQTELTVWMEKSALLKEELKSRFSSLCDIQEDITKALKVSAEDYDFKFTSYQAAKFQGEVLNMKQENNKVADELQAGLDHVTNLQIEVEKTLGVLSEEFGISASKSSPNMEYQRSGSKSRVPLRSFIFGVKPKKQKTSFLACVHPALHRKYNHRPLNG